MNDLLLLPRPRNLLETGGRVDPNGLPVDTTIVNGVNGDRNPEAYRIEVSASRIVLEANTETGLRWARATLEQLRQQGEIPCLIIEDVPLFANRGVMLDISRDRVPTMQSLYALVDKLSAWKMNHLQLYVEHALAYKGHEAVWQAASPLTLEELADLDAYAGKRGIALSANQNCLGHFERWLCHPDYAPLGECESGSLVHGLHYKPPNTLCPLDPKTLDLIRDLLGQQLPICSGPYANIGCDEPWDLGRGRSREACEARGKAAVFSEYLSRVAGMARALGKRPMFWCDPEPNENDALPPELVALVWQYEDHLSFGPRVRSHRASGREVWVVPGTSCWNSSTGRTWNRRANLDKAAAEHEATGFLCTAWGDGGHRQPWPVTLIGFADAAMAAWSGPGNYDDASAGQQAFGNPALGEWLAGLGNVDADFCSGKIAHRDGSPAERGDCHNTTALWKEMHTPFLDERGLGNAGDWERLRARLGESAAAIPDVADSLIRDECALAVDIARWTAQRAVLRRTGREKEGRRRLAEEMIGIIARHRQQWIQRCRYGGLKDSTAHFEQFCRSF